MNDSAIVHFPNSNEAQCNAETQLMASLHGFMTGWLRTKALLWSPHNQNCSSPAVVAFASAYISVIQTSVKDKNTQDERELRCLSGPGCCPASAPPAGQPWPGSNAPSSSESLARSGLSCRSAHPGFLCIVHMPSVSPTDQRMADMFN